MNRSEIIGNSLYDFQFYRDGAMYFFQFPVGVVGKTLSDTNMMYGAMMPPENSFLVEWISVELMTADTGAAWRVYERGVLEFNILQKNYLREAPLAQFIPLNSMPFSASLYFPYQVTTPLMLSPNHNFDVRLSGLPRAPDMIAAQTRIGVRLGGRRARAVM